MAFWGLVQQRGPWRETAQDRARLRENQTIWRGGATAAGGTEHAGHGHWLSEFNPSYRQGPLPSKGLLQPSRWAMRVPNVVSGPQQSVHFRAGVAGRPSNTHRPPVGMRQNHTATQTEGLNTSLYDETKRPGESVAQMPEPLQGGSVPQHDVFSPDKEQAPSTRLMQNAAVQSTSREHVLSTGEGNAKEVVIKQEAGTQASLANLPDADNAVDLGESGVTDEDAYYDQAWSSFGLIPRRAMTTQTDPTTTPPQPPPLAVDTRTVATSPSERFSATVEKAADNLTREAIASHKAYYLARVREAQRDIIAQGRAIVELARSNISADLQGQFEVAMDKVRAKEAELLKRSNVLGEVEANTQAMMYMVLVLGGATDADIIAIQDAFRTHEPNRFEFINEYLATYYPAVNKDMAERFHHYFATQSEIEKFIIENSDGILSEMQRLGYIPPTVNTTTPARAAQDEAQNTANNLENHSTQVPAVTSVVGGNTSASGPEAPPTQPTPQPPPVPSGGGAASAPPERKSTRVKRPPYSQFKASGYSEEGLKGAHLRVSHQGRNEFNDEHKQFLRTSANEGLSKATRKVQNTTILKAARVAQRTRPRRATVNQF